MSIGDDILSEIIKQGMVRIDGPEAVVFVWNANAAEQLDALVGNRLETLGHVLNSTLEISEEAMKRDKPEDLYSACHAARDNIRTSLAILGRKVIT